MSDLIKAATEAGMAEEMAEQARDVLLDALRTLEPADYTWLSMAIGVVRAARQRHEDVVPAGWRPEVAQWAEQISDLPMPALKALRAELDVAVAITSKKPETVASAS